MKNILKSIIFLIFVISLFSCQKEKIEPSNTNINQNTTINYTVNIQHSGVYTVTLNGYNLGAPGTFFVKTGDKIEVISMQTFSSQTMKVYIDNVIVFSEIGTNLFYEKQF